MSGAGRRRPAGAVVVVKVGGSLLDLPQLRSRLSSLLDTLAGERPLIIAGGGRASDLVRGWDRAFALGEERSHWLALSAMALNGGLLAALLPGSRLVRDREEISAAWAASSIPVLDPRAFAQSDERSESGAGRLEPGGRPLPHLWAATSDSVAAWVAHRLEAEELCLVKSAPAPAGATLADLAARGYLDGHLVRLAAGLKRISLVDLRGAENERRPVRR